MNNWKPRDIDIRCPVGEIGFNWPEMSITIEATGSIRVLIKKANNHWYTATFEEAHAALSAAIERRDAAFRAAKEPGK